MNENNYYRKAHQASKDSLSHPALKEIKKLSQKSQKILDFGCGEGTKLALLTPKTKKRFGVDISQKAINLAKKKYKDIDFFQGNIEEGLKLKSESFDFVYSAFVLEHLENPEKFLKEAIRLTKKDGKIALVAPNYGSPNRASPCFSGSRIKKLIFGFLSDLSLFLKDQNSLNWLKVEPRLSEKYQIDFDTTIEPYLLTLYKFLEKEGVKTLKCDSLWSQEQKNAKFHQKFFRFLAELKLSPFFYWGPHLFYVGEKK